MARRGQTSSRKAINKGAGIHAAYKPGLWRDRAGLVWSDLASPRLVSFHLAWRGIYSEVTFTAYLPARARLALRISRSFPALLPLPRAHRCILVLPFIATPKAKNDGEFTAPPPPPRLFSAPLPPRAEQTVSQFP